MVRIRYNTDLVTLYYAFITFTPVFEESVAKVNGKSCMVQLEKSKQVQCVYCVVVL